MVDKLAYRVERLSTARATRADNSVRLKMGKIVAVQFSADSVEQLRLEHDRLQRLGSVEEGLEGSLYQLPLKLLLEVLQYFNMNICGQWCPQIA